MTDRSEMSERDEIDPVFRALLAVVTEFARTNHDALVIAAALGEVASLVMGGLPAEVRSTALPQWLALVEKHSHGYAQQADVLRDYERTH